MYGYQCRLVQKSRELLAFNQQLRREADWKRTNAREDAKKKKTLASSSIIISPRPRDQILARFVRSEPPTAANIELLEIMLETSQGCTLLNLQLNHGETLVHAAATSDRTDNTGWLAYLLPRLGDDHLDYSGRLAIEHAPLPPMIYALLEQWHEEQRQARRSHLRLLSLLCLQKSRGPMGIIIPAAIKRQITQFLYIGLRHRSRSRTARR